MELTWTTVENTWTEIVTQDGQEVPDARSGHTAVVYKDSLYVFGGRNEEPRYFADIWQFNFGE